MDLNKLIGKEIFLKPDFKGSIFIHNQPDYNGISTELKANDRIGKVETFVKSKKITGVNFIVVKRGESFWYCDLDFLNDIYYSDLSTNKIPTIVSTKTNTTLYMSIAAAALLLFFIIRKK
jgi:hypothetical protein